MIMAVALLLICSCASCQKADRSRDDAISSALRELVVASSDDLKSYTFFMKMELDMVVENLSSGQSQRLQTRSIGFGLVNMTDKALKLAIASLTLAPGDEGNSSAMALEEYLQNETIYIKMNGNWTALTLSGLGGAWSRQNPLEQQADMLNLSRLTLIGSEMVEGEECYKVRAEVDIASYADLLSREAAAYVPFLPMNIPDLFRNASLEVHYWISKESHLIKRADISETLYMTTPSMEQLAAGEENTAISITSTISMLFDGFNESINITLPAEASAAQLLQIPSYPQSEAVALSPVDEMGLNETAVTEPLAAMADALPDNAGAVLGSQSQENSSRLKASNTTINGMMINNTYAETRLPLPDPRPGIIH